jgi:signal transduction histidine kinase
MSSEDGAFRQGLHKIKTLAENRVNEVRNMALLLRPSMLDDLGLVVARARGFEQLLETRIRKERPGGCAPGTESSPS